MSIPSVTAVKVCVVFVGENLEIFPFFSGSSGLKFV